MQLLAATHLELVTEWQLRAPLERVWEELSHPDAWPAWWRAVQRVEKITDGGPDGVGAVRRFTWATALPYTLTFELEATRIEPMHIIEGRARGELDGVGRWTIAPDGAGTHVRYDWKVDVTKPWQRLLAPVLKPVFAWNHNVIMGWGYEGLVKRLRGG